LLAPLAADRALEPAYFVVTRGRKNASPRFSSARRRAIRGWIARSVFDCSLRSLRIALGSRCLPHSSQTEKRCLLSRSSRQRRAILVARIALWNPPTSSSLGDERTRPLASPQHGGARSGVGLLAPCLIARSAR
jgi:hypothetical protein